MFFSHKVILSKLLVVFCCVFAVFAQHAAGPSNKQAAAFVTAGTIATAARMSAEKNVNYHAILKCMPAVFFASLATIIVADRAYNGEWDLLKRLVSSCGISLDCSAKKNYDSATGDINDDFIDYEAGGDNDSDNSAEAADGCCSGCCSC